MSGLGFARLANSLEANKPEMVMVESNSYSAPTPAKLSATATQESHVAMRTCRRATMAAAGGK